MISNRRMEKQAHSAVEFGKVMPKQILEDFIQAVGVPPEPTPAAPPRSPVDQEFSPPLPPPPNPQYLPPDVDSTEIEPPDVLLARATPDPRSGSLVYDEHTTGALTYYNYYFEASQPAPAPVQPLETRSKRTMGLAGAGVVAATVVSGLIVHDAWQKSQVPEAASKNSSNQADTDQKAAKNPARPTLAAPERQQMERSPITPTSPAPALPKLRPRNTSSLGQLDSLPPPLPLAPAIASPETLALQPASKSGAVNPPSSPAQSALKTLNPNNSSRINLDEVARQQTGRAAISPPEQLPMGGRSTRGIALTPETALSPTEPRTNAAPLASPPLTVPAAAIQSEGLQPAAIADSPPALSQNQPLSAQPTPASENSGLQQLFPNRAPNSELSGSAPSPATSASFSGANPTPTEPTPRLQDYLNPPNATPATPPLSLMPLSQQAATEAGQINQVGQFTVRQVNPQDYQKEWLASNKTAEDPAIALAFPAYGFIDYQRQVIIVLQDLPQPAPMQSQRTLLPSS